MIVRRWVVSLCVGFAIAGCDEAPPEQQAVESSPVEITSVPEASLAPLLDGIGDHHFAITTDSERAQRFFDQGLILSYGFNHAEAIRAFREAARLDPTCGIC